MRATGRSARPASHQPPTSEATTAIPPTTASERAKLIDRAPDPGKAAAGDDANPVLGGDHVDGVGRRPQRHVGAGHPGQRRGEAGWRSRRRVDQRARRVEQRDKRPRGARNVALLKPHLAIVFEARHDGRGACLERLVQQ